MESKSRLDKDGLEKHTALKGEKFSFSGGDIELEDGVNYKEEYKRLCFILKSIGKAFGDFSKSLRECRERT